MMRFAVIAACSLLVLTTMGHTHEEKDLICNDSFVPATSVCDGTLDCSELDDISNDESPHICAPLPYLEWEASLAVHNVTSTSVQLSWTMTTANDSEDSLLLAGYFLTGKSEGRSFQNTISGRLLSHPIQWLKPWTDYTFILRPFYTETGRPHRQYKVGKAASAQIRTLSSVPEVPSLVSVVSAQPRNVVLSIVGPSAWNCAPVGFNLQWEATSESRGPRGSMEAPLTEDWSPEENTFNVTLPLRGGTDYRISVRATGTNSHGDKVWGPDLEIEVSVTLDFPRPALTKVAATSSSSFEVAWTFPQDDTRLYKGFQVLYCPTNQDICTVLYTTENSVTVSGLAPNSAFNIYVQAQLTNFDGRPILGPAAKASITTWNNLPMLHTKYAATIQESNDCLLQWTCYNSTIDYFQYKTRTDDSWTTCKNTADCDVTFFHERRVTSTSGYIRFGHEAQYGYGEVFVRGCNGNGCGPESSTYVPAVVTGPSRLSAVSVTPEGERAHVSWLVSEKRVYDGIEVVWNCSTTEAVFNIRLSKRTYGAAAPLYVPSENAEKCTFNASTYLDNQNGATYYSTPVQATQKGIVH
ncbi:receptor-type tyrosine-protein phosphatase F isoform X2 [Rhipicephalus microplus]|uniref:receptor-type tyrosine-protein phosphatase F isoform X2 n=1 Tax=Rhipicephalus microplus TaxID=6941 RepID=UPI003F6D297F